MQDEIGIIRLETIDTGDENFFNLEIETQHETHTLLIPRMAHPLALAEALDDIFLPDGDMMTPENQYVN